MGAGAGSGNRRRQPARLVAALLRWYDRERRALPWRALPGERAEPYHVLLSEMMLQQTTVATVRGRFAAFLARFPDLHTVAAADLAEVLHAWQGLGYYRRARALHACARAVVDDHGGTLPIAETALLALPGIGPYTAAALRAIAFDQPTVAVDGNVQRVMARLHGVTAPLPAAAGTLRELAGRLAGPKRPGDLAQALMDLGATVCRPTRPQCASCPWRGACASHAAGIAADLPTRAAKAVRPLRCGLAFLLTRPDGAILFRQRPDDGLLGGLHELPSSPWQATPPDPASALGHAPAIADWRVDATPVRHGFTHFVLELTLARATALRPPAGLWCLPADLGRLSLPTLTRKLLHRAGVLDQAKRPGPP